MAALADSRPRMPREGSLCLHNIHAHGLVAVILYTVFLLKQLLDPGSLHRTSPHTQADDTLCVRCITLTVGRAVNGALATVTVCVLVAGLGTRFTSAGRS